MRIKPGVDLRNLQPQTVLAMIVAEEVVARETGTELMISSAFRPGKENLLHSTGLAFDMSIRDPNNEVWPDSVLNGILDGLHRRIGKKFGGQYDVVDERMAPGGPHFHIEFDPR